ncbi:zinc ribbon domain-containing protein [Shewanella sp. 10N.286.45.A1]|uniref:zinc ribbon domain-containing protein n=1 Tax=Shewanella sp. 10N.286.45.A1 TaxID=3229694 RepID=UPI00355091EA
MQHEKWTCIKCNHREFETGEIRVSGGFWSRIFDMQNKRYYAVTCSNCSYTEFYKGKSSALGNAFDLFT